MSRPIMLQQSDGATRIYGCNCKFALFITFIFYVLTSWLMLMAMRQLAIISNPVAIVLLLLSVIVITAWMWDSFLRTTRAEHLLRGRRYTAVFTLGPHKSKIIKSTVREELESPFSDTFELISLETRQISKNLELNKKEYWQTYDMVSDIYRRSGDTRLYKSRQAFYTVFEAKLQRTIPHLVFDSKTAKGRQFRRIYLNTQHLTLDGDFNDYFDAYSPQGYEVDTLSFITPEVIVAMLDMHDCDIEFIEDGLLCYGPLLDEVSLEELQKNVSTFMPVSTII